MVRESISTKCEYIPELFAENAYALGETVCTRYSAMASLSAEPVRSGVFPIN